MILHSYVEEATVMCKKQERQFSFLDGSVFYDRCLQFVGPLHYIEVIIRMQQPNLLNIQNCT